MAFGGGIMAVGNNNQTEKRLWEAADELSKIFTRKIYSQKCDVIFQNGFENYYGEDKSVYAMAV
jgi:hypothetical protein